MGATITENAYSLKELIFEKIKRSSHGLCTADFLSSIAQAHILDVRGALDSLTEAGYIKRHNGFYFPQADTLTPKNNVR